MRRFVLSMSHNVKLIYTLPQISNSKWVSFSKGNQELTRATKFMGLVVWILKKRQPGFFKFRTLQHYSRVVGDCCIVHANKCTSSSTLLVID